VGGAWIDEVRKPELLNAPEPLKRTSLDDAPKHAFPMRPLDVEFDRSCSGSRIRCCLGIRPNHPRRQQICIIEQTGNTSTSFLNPEHSTVKEAFQTLR